MHLAQHNVTREFFAVKTIEKSRVLSTPAALTMTQNEILILRRLDHQYIMKLYEVYESKSSIHLILEYLKGGALVERMKAHAMFSEGDTSRLMRCVFEGLDYCHTRSILHRDLKLENLLLAYCSRYHIVRGNCVVKIADFGLSTTMNPSVPERQKCGSPGYVAPEVLNDWGYNTKADIFSAGVILYTLYSISANSG